MLVPDLNMVLLNIPKCGSSTVRRCLENHIQKHKMIAQNANFLDHLSLSEMALKLETLGFNIQKLRIIGIVRNPLDRYLSALNYAFGDKYSCSLAECVDMTLTKDSGDKYSFRMYFRTMSSFLNSSVKNLKLFRFEDISAAVKSFGHTGSVPHLNKSRKRFNIAELKPYIKDIQSFYCNDFNLYENTPCVEKGPAHVC